MPKIDILSAIYKIKRAWDGVSALTNMLMFQSTQIFLHAAYYQMLRSSVQLTIQHKMMTNMFLLNLPCFRNMYLINIGLFNCFSVLK
ncbi:hypothetical protein BpHYR1_026435 [Brachionus plicatilis]|uniref:Uncharacterized protein n=1 Tax=Brachionus plicatilis TaxID=10195 RepID=A0A3M7S8F7_BRAPC|nr:hypothetical protein BpHYR1_026435 [Brachionus plicatilis]